MATERQELIKKLDKIFSQYIRLRDADDNGYVRCCSSNVAVNWKEADCGHFIPREHMATRWCEYNCHAQSVNANRFLDGDMDRYADFIVDKYGEYTLNKLYGMKRQSRKWGLFELKEMIKVYRDHVKKLKKEKGL